MQAFSLGVAQAVLALGLAPFTGVIGGAIGTAFGQSMAHL